MSLFSKICLLLPLLLSNVSFAADNDTHSKEKTFSIEALVDQFYQQKEAIDRNTREFSTKARRNPIHCPDELDNGAECAEAACKRLGHFGCDEFHEIDEVNRACRGNFGKTCFEAVCSRLGNLGCDDMNEVKTVARACVGNYDTRCFESVCKRLGHFGCDQIHEVEKVLKSCAGN